MANTFYTSPKGRASYPKLVVPDTKFNAEGVYTVKLIIPKDEAQELIERIEEVFVEEYGPKKLSGLNRPYKEDENGDLVFNFKSKKKPTIFDATGKPIAESVLAKLKIGSGTLMKVKGSIGPNFVQGKHYATLWMNAVQILELVEFQGGAGFAADDSGSFKADGIGEDEAKGNDAAETEDF